MRDMKVCKDHVFISSEASNHGIQVFDLRQVSSTLAAYTANETSFSVITSGSGLKRLDVIFTETAWYGGVGKLINRVEQHSVTAN